MDLSKKIYLTSGIFFSGAAVMLVELVGTRIINPIFGSGIYVWSALISITLAALSIGYWIGGVIADKKPTLLFLHHSFGDEDGNLQDDLRFFNIIQPHRHVKAVFYGHSHRYQFSKQDDLDLINIPSTAYNFDETSPVGWVSAEFTATGASLQLNAIAGNRAEDSNITTIQWRG